MKCLILAAGYATRLYPLTENFPKPLLEVQGKTILDWLTEDIGETDTVVVTNHRFAPIFEDWAKAKANITVLDDGTSSNETRLGAVCDIRFGVNHSLRSVNGHRNALRVGHLHHLPDGIDYAEDI